MGKPAVSEHEQLLHIHLCCLCSMITALIHYNLMSEISRLVASHCWLTDWFVSFLVKTLFWEGLCIDSGGVMLMVCILIGGFPFCF